MFKVIRHNQDIVDPLLKELIFLGWLAVYLNIVWDVILHAYV